MEAPVTTEKDIVDEDLDDELKDLFLSLISAQEDYKFIVESNPKNPSRESQEKIREVLRLMDREIAIQEVNLRQMEKLGLKSLRGMTKSEVVEILGKVSAEKMNLLQFVEKEVRVPEPVRKEKCVCCTVSENNLTPMYKSSEGPVCKDCHTLLCPDTPLELYISPQTASTCDICKQSKALVKYDPVRICHDCSILIDEPAIEDSIFLCPKCNSDKTTRDKKTGVHTCIDCHNDFQGWFSSTLKKKGSETSHKRSVEFSNFTSICPVCGADETTKRCTNCKLDLQSTTSNKALLNEQCSVCNSTDIRFVPGNNRYYCNGVCNKFIGKIVSMLIHLRARL